MAVLDLSPDTGVPVDTTDRINGVVLPIFAILAILLTYLPFRSFYQNRNFPAANMVVVVTIQNLIIFMNAIIWPNGDWTSWWRGVGLCDVQVYIRIPITTAIATSMVAFTRQLANALDVDKHNFVDTPAMRRRVLIVDILICWTVPVLQFALYYIIQLSRYAIMPVYGCAVIMDVSWVTTVIMYIWAPLFSLISAYHAVLIMIRLHKHKANLSRALSSTNSGHNARRYLKLFMIAVFLIIVLIPIEFYCLYLNLPAKLIPYSWSRVHDPLSWNAIIFLSTSDVPGLQYFGWISIAFCFQVFMFFGFNDDALEIYRRGLVMVGLGKIWPTLREPLEARRLRSMRRGSDTRTSWSSRFDLVSKALHYFDGSRKNSEATTVQGSEYDQSRKGSHATADIIALANVTSHASSSTSKKPLSSAGDSTLYQSFFDADTITPAPGSITPTTTLQPLQEQEPAVTSSTPTPNPVSRGGVLSTWRTRINLPFPLFSSSSSSHSESIRTEKRISQSKQDEEDLEAQNLHRKSSLSNITLPPTTISTAIWSESFAPNTNTHASHASTSTLTHLSVDEDSEMVDPLSPKMGSRAYRERERREMERDRKEALRGKKGSVESGGGGGGVVKTTMMEISEEEAGSGST